MECMGNYIHRDTILHKDIVINQAVMQRELLKGRIRVLTLNGMDSGKCMGNYTHRDTALHIDRVTATQFWINNGVLLQISGSTTISCKISAFTRWGGVALIKTENSIVLNYKPSDIHVRMLWIMIPTDRNVSLESAESDISLYGNSKQLIKNLLEGTSYQCVTIPKIWTKPNPKLFSHTKFFRYRIRYFFQY